MSIHDETVDGSGAKDCDHRAFTLLALVVSVFDDRCDELGVTV